MSSEVDLEGLPWVPLRELREKQRFPRTQGELAEKAKMQRTGVNRLERAGSLAFAKIETIRRYLDALGYELHIVAERKLPTGGIDDRVLIADPDETDQTLPPG